MRSWGAAIEPANRKYHCDHSGVGSPGKNNASESHHQRSLWRRFEDVDKSTIVTDNNPFQNYYNEQLILNLSLYWKENLQVCYYSVLSFLQNIFLQLSGSWHLLSLSQAYKLVFFFWVKHAVFFIFAGGNPYDGMSGQEVFTYVSHGHKLRRSSGVSRELYVESRSS